MPAELRFGIIGCGEIAVQTCAGISAAPNATVAMLMDPRPEVLADLAEFYGVPTTTQAEEVFSNPDIDAVYIATPHDLHAPLGIQAARAGKHVLVEKPIATNLKDADTLIETCRATGVKLGVAYLAQVDAGAAQARDYIHAGLLGDLIAVRMTALAHKPDYYWQGGYTRRVATTWRQSKARAGGGILIMNLVHDLNTVRWVTGLEVQRVYAEYDTLATPVEVEDTLGAVLRYTNGAIGVIQAGSAMPGGAHKDARGPRIYGTKGQIILGDPPLIYRTEAPEGSAPNTWSELRYSGPKGDRAEMIRRFAEAVLNGQEPPATGEDGRKALEIIVAAYRSGEMGRPVELPLET
ncbi:MAG: Gfo/Idh/MocA family oxidoreductase [Chloroflexi bacterium]|nr:Gfo/Idh/MocA family oxidoreductase [Chloroflexota bacterium]